MKKTNEKKIGIEKYTISRLNMSRVIGGDGTDGDTLDPISTRVCKDNESKESSGG